MIIWHSELSEYFVLFSDWPVMAVVKWPALWLLLLLHLASLGWASGEYYFHYYYYYYY